MIRSATKQVPVSGTVSELWGYQPGRIGAIIGQQSGQVTSMSPMNDVAVGTGLNLNGNNVLPLVLVGPEYRDLLQRPWFIISTGAGTVMVIELYDTEYV